MNDSELMQIAEQNDISGSQRANVPKTVVFICYQLLISFFCLCGYLLGLKHGTLNEPCPLTPPPKVPFDF